MAAKNEIYLQPIIILLSLLLTQTTTLVLCVRDAEAISPSAAPVDESTSAGPSSEPDEKTDESKADIVPDKAFIFPTDNELLQEWFEEAMKKIEEKKALEPDLIAAEKNPKIIKVSQKGEADFKTIKEAVDSIEDKNTNRVIIKIDGGEYKEQITIDGDNSFVSLVGNPEDIPVLTFDGTTQKSGLMDSATLAVEGDYFQAANLIIKNTAKPKEDGALGGNGIALRVKGDAAYFQHCEFESAMDTIRDDDGRHFFAWSIIRGNNDIIFGDGRTIYMSGNFNLTDAKPDGSITANEREDPNDESGGGFVLVLCDFSNDHGAKADNLVYWGRPGAAGARVIVARGKVGPYKAIKPERWTSNPAHPNYDKTVFFAEYKNEEGDADLSKMVKFAKKLNDEEADKYVTLDYIQATKWLIPIPEYAEAEEKRPIPKYVEAEERQK